MTFDIVPASVFLYTYKDTTKYITSTITSKILVTSTPIPNQEKLKSQPTSTAKPAPSPSPANSVSSIVQNVVNKLTSIIKSPSQK